MTVILVVIAVACVIGLARGGSWQHLSQLDLRSWPLVFVAVLLQAVGAFAGSSLLYVVGMVSSAALVVVFVARNAALPGIPLVGIGFLLNALVVVANGAMPVSQEAADRVGLSTAGLYEGSDAKHEIADERTRLEPLADIIPVPLPRPLHRASNVISVGDVVLAAGIGVLVTNGMLGTRRRRQMPVGRHARQDP